MAKKLNQEQFKKIALYEYHSRIVRNIKIDLSEGSPSYLVGHLKNWRKEFGLYLDYHENRLSEIGKPSSEDWNRYMFIRDESSLSGERLHEDYCVLGGEPLKDPTL